MKFGVREICDVVFKAKARQKIGSHTFEAGQPVLYIDTATTSTLEGAATTVYAQGGRGNSRLIAWEGEKTLTFTVEDALLSPIGFSILSGAGLFNGSTKTSLVHVHKTATVTATEDNYLDLTGAINTNPKTGATATKETDQKEYICDNAPIFVLPVEGDGSIVGTMLTGVKVAAYGGSDTSIKDKTKKNFLKTEVAEPSGALKKITAGTTYFVDFYVVREASNVTELQIDMKKFGGYFYVEASTLFRDQNTGVDMPAELTFPNVKIQSNFTFNMASTGDPSTFTFTMDAFPGYTTFDKTKKVLCCIQVVNDTDTSSEDIESVMGHTKGHVGTKNSNNEEFSDSVPDSPNALDKDEL